MYSLTIHFGPNAICWALLFKEEEKAKAAYDKILKISGSYEDTRVTDDFGQTLNIPSVVHGILFEDLDQVEAARIQRSLAEERCKVKLMAAAKNDPVIGEAIRQQQRGAPVLTPMGGFRQ